MRVTVMTKAPVIAFVKQCALQRQQKVNDFKSGDLSSNQYIIFYTHIIYIYIYIYVISGTEDVHTQSHWAK